MSTYNNDRSEKIYKSRSDRFENDYENEGSNFWNILILLIVFLMFVGIGLFMAIASNPDLLTSAMGV